LAHERLDLFQIKLVNINSSDLVDGRPPVVLGLIWTIILYFQVWTPKWKCFRICMGLPITVVCSLN